MTVLLRTSKSGQNGSVLIWGQRRLRQYYVGAVCYVMGAVLAEEVVGIKTPRGATHRGRRKPKGLADSIREASFNVKIVPTINYIGYLEANELLTEKLMYWCEDGLQVPLTLKTMEGLLRMFLFYR